jgi:hypothetical protein
MGYFWINSTVKSFSKIGEPVKIPSIGAPQMPALNILQTTTPSDGTLFVGATASQTADWKIYTNNDYNFQIEYPSDWSAREYGSGVALSPKNKLTQDGAINIEFLKRGVSYCKIPFADYVKIAGPSEIQNYESVNTINEGATDSGLDTYQVTWNYIDMQGAGKISLPIAYFETKPELCGDIEAFLNDNNYSDIYNNIILTFKFTK